MRVRIKQLSKRGPYAYEVDPIDLPGSPNVGRGPTIHSAMGQFLHLYAEKLGIELDFDQECLDVLIERNKRLLKKR